MSVLRIILASWLIIIASATSGYADRDPHNNEPNDLAFTAESGSEVSKLIEEDGRFERALAACPADIFSSEQSYSDWLGFSNPYSYRGCARDPQGCFKACAAGDGETCFKLARSLQRAENLEAGATSRRMTQRAFAFGCAAGYHSACTNRGAGILNGTDEDDPKGEWSQERVDTCTFRTFELACKGDTGWGCAMLGQAHMYGQGTPEDRDRARRNFLKVCKPNQPDHPSCKFAQRKLDQIDE